MAIQEVFLPTDQGDTSTEKKLSSREGPISYESSFWADVRERRATPARTTAILNVKIRHCKIEHGDKSENWYIGHLLHYGRGPAKIGRAAVRQRVVEAPEVGKIIGPTAYLGD